MRGLNFEFKRKFVFIGSTAEMDLQVTHAGFSDQS